MVQWLLGETLPFCLVLTKTDQLRQSERQPARRAIVGALDMPVTQPLVPYSSHTGEGRAALLAWIRKTLETVGEG